MYELKFGSKASKGAYFQVGSGSGSGYLGTWGASNLKIVAL